MMTETVLKMRESFTVLPDGVGFRMGAEVDAAVGVVTDHDGYARANFTPTAGGSSHSSSKY